MKKSIVRKLLPILLCLSLLVCFAACRQTGASSAPSGTQNSTPASSSGPFHIGLIQYMEHPSLDTIREAFLDRLEEWGYDDAKVTVDYQNASGDMSNVNTICQKFVGDQVDMIVAIATPAAQVAAAAAENTDIPVVFAAVSNAKEDLGIADPEHPEGNVTGTSDLVPVTAAVDLALRVDPDLKTFGLLYSSGESNAVANAQEAKAYLESKNIEVIEGTVSNTSEIQQVATSLCEKADAIFSSTDNAIAQNIAVVTEATRKAKVPWYVGADSMVQDGGLAAIGIDYTELGHMNADMAVEILEGKPVSEVPVFTFETYDTYVNEDTLAALGVELPQDVLDSAVFLSDGGQS